MFCKYRKAVKRLLCSYLEALEAEYRPRRRVFW